MIMKVKLKLPRKKQVITLNCRISTDMYFESRPHLRKVSILSLNTSL